MRGRTALLEEAVETASCPQAGFRAGRLRGASVSSTVGSVHCMGRQWESRIGVVWQGGAFGFEPWLKRAAQEANLQGRGERE